MTNRFGHEWHVGWLKREIIPPPIEVGCEQHDPPFPFLPLEDGRRSVVESRRDIPPGPVHPPGTREPHVAQIGGKRAERIDKPCSLIICIHSQISSRRS